MDQKEILVKDFFRDMEKAHKAYMESSNAIFQHYKNAINSVFSQEQKQRNSLAALALSPIPESKQKPQVQFDVTSGQVPLKRPSYVASTPIPTTVALKRPKMELPPVEDCNEPKMELLSAEDFNGPMSVLIGIVNEAATKSMPPPTQVSQFKGPLPQIVQQAISEKDEQVVQTTKVVLEFKKKDGKFECPICNKLFTTLSYVKNEHIQIHNDEKFDCPTCEKTYPLKRSRDKHAKKCPKREQQEQEE